MGGLDIRSAFNDGTHMYYVLQHMYFESTRQAGNDIEEVLNSGFHEIALSARLKASRYSSAGQF